METEFGWTMLFSAGLYQALLLSAILLIVPKQNKLANRLLAGMVLIIGVRVGFTLARISPIGVSEHLFVPFNLPMTLLYGPLLYLYIKSFIQRDFQLRRKDYVLFIPAGVIFLVVLFLPMVGGGEIEPPPESDAFSWDMVPTKAWVIAGAVAIYSSVYLGLTFQLILRFARYVKRNASDTNSQYFRWMVCMLILMLIPALSVTATVLLTNLPPLRTLYPAIAGSFLVCVLGILSILNPDVINGIPQEFQLEHEDDLLPEKYVSSSLTETQKANMLAQLLRHMEESRPFLNPTLTLKTLADQLGINAKYLSQVINEKQDQHFMDFINAYRVARAKEMLTHTAYANYTILAIAQEVGFNSKSAFYTAFKKFTEQTPSAYKKASLAAKTAQPSH